MLSLRRFGLISCLFSGLLMSFASSAEARVYVAEPLLVAQPSYAGMQFYVYRPYKHAEELVYDLRRLSHDEEPGWGLGVWHRVRPQPESDEL